MMKALRTLNRIKMLRNACGGLRLRNLSLLAGVLVLCLLICAAVSAQLLLFPVANAVAEQSFYAPVTWAQELTREQGWGPDHPRMLADVNGDKRQDVVGFGQQGVWLATSTGYRFNPAYVLADFGYQSGWRVEKHVRTTGDINGDKWEDIVGFGNAGVYRSLSTGSGFAQAAFVIADFGYDQGWRVEKHVRLLADVNGDGRKDILAFGDAGVWLALATAQGYFAAPRYVLAEFGFNQGWMPAKHIRTTADVNGDGRQDIVGFGDYGVWIALSTGSGFSAPQYVLADFGYISGSWRLDRHPRFLADINSDGKQDIVAFGDDGVWVARSTGSGFAAAQFVLADFGYNQGWRVGTHPRFVADLNGDGYQDLVGFGDDLIYRSLGGPNGFANLRGVLRDLVAKLGFPWNTTPDVLTDYFPRLIGDIDGNGMQDLVVFDRSEIKVLRSSNLPPPPPPDAPSNLRITNTGVNSLTIAWNDNSDDERHFIVNYNKVGGSPQTATLSANVTSRVFGSLAANAQFCFTVQAESIWGFSPETPRVCGHTKAEPPPSKGPFTTTINMARQPIIQGPVPYLGTFGPINSGAIIAKINFPKQFPAVLLVKPGFSTNNCGNPNAVILVHGDMTADHMKAIWGTANITLSGRQTLPFVGCSTSSQLLNLLPVNITWSQP
jgi:hypothetical protein